MGDDEHKSDVDLSQGDGKPVSTEDLEIPEISGAPAEEKKRGLIGALPGAAAGGGKVGFLSLLTGVVPKVMLAMTVGGVVLVPMLNKLKCADCAAKSRKDAQQVSRQKPAELPSDKYAQKVAASANLDNVDLLRAKHAGLGLRTGDDYVAPEDSGQQGAAATAESAANKSAADAQAVAKQPDMSKLLGEMQKKGFGSLGGGFGGDSAFGGGGGFGSGGVGKVNYGAENPFSGKLSAGFKGGTPSGGMNKEAKVKTADVKLAKSAARLKKSMSQLKLAAAMSKRGAGAKTGTLASAYGQAAFDQSRIAGGAGISGAGAGISGAGLQGETPELLSDEPTAGKEVPKDVACANALKKANKDMQAKMKEMNEVKWDGHNLSKPPTKCCVESDINAYNDAVDNYKAKCGEYNRLAQKADKAWAGQAGISEQNCDIYEKMEPCGTFKCYVLPIVLALAAAIAILATAGTGTMAIIAAVLAFTATGAGSMNGIWF